MAESTIEQYPDSALLFLDSIIQPSSLSEKDWHDYTLLKIQAKDKLYQNITQDTAIFSTIAYYTEQKDISKLTRAQYYCGRLWHEAGNTDKAMNAYLNANKYAEKLPNGNTLKGVIHANMGYLLFEESDYREALSHFETALEYFQKGNDISRTIGIKTDIGNCYMMMDKNDSASVYYNQSLDLAEISNLPDIKLKTLQNLGLVY